MHCTKSTTYTINAEYISAFPGERLLRWIATGWILEHSHNSEQLFLFFLIAIHDTRQHTTIILMIKIKQLHTFAIHPRLTIKWVPFALMNSWPRLVGCDVKLQQNNNHVLRGFKRNVSLSRFFHGDHKSLKKKLTSIEDKAKFHNPKSHRAK